MTKNAADIAAIAHIRTYDPGTDTDNITSRGDIVAGPKAQGRVGAAGAIVFQGMSAICCIEIPGCVGTERVVTVGCVVVSRCVSH